MDYAIEGMNQTYTFKQYLSENTIPVFSWNEEYFAGTIKTIWLRCNTIKNSMLKLK